MSETASKPDLTQGVAASSLADGVPFAGRVGEDDVILVKRGADVFAIGASCSHYGGPLAEGLVVDDTIRCPWHHACFDLRTGEATKAPALSDVPCYDVVQRDGRVSVGAKRAPMPRRTLPSKGPSSIVVLGAGAAGGAAVEAMRREGYDGPITLVGAEASGPIDRPNLSKDYLFGGVGDDALPLRPREFYDEIGVALELGTAAVSIDPAKKQVALADGRTLDYGALLLATGAEPVRLPIPGATLPHVHVLRSVSDARAIVGRTLGARHAAVIGASFIGLEAAAALRKRGLEVDVIAPESLPLARILGAELGLFVQRVHERHGVRFNLATKPRAIRPHEVELESGKVIPADLVVIGVGVRPRTQLAEAAGLKVDNGVVVDELLKTSAPDVFAAGDIARYPEPRLGQPVRVEHWVVAERQGQAAARAMVGRGEPYRDVPFFWSLHHDVNLGYIGHAPMWDRIEVRGSLEAHDALVVYWMKGEPHAVVTVDRDHANLEAEAALERGGFSALEALLKSGTL